MYRMVKHTPLTTGQQYGDIIKDGDLDRRAIEILLARGILTRITAPPLSELPDCWEKRAAKLMPAGIVNLDQFIKADVADVAKIIKMSKRTVARWQQEAMDYLNPKITKKGK